MDLADVGWMETKDPVVAELDEFIQGVRNYTNDFGECPFRDFNVLYNLSPSFNWQYNFGKQAAPLAKELLKQFKGLSGKSLSKEEGGRWIADRIAAFGDTHDFSKAAAEGMFTCLQGTLIEANVRKESLQKLTSNVDSYVKEGKISLEDMTTLNAAIQSLTADQLYTEKLQKLIANEHMRLFSSEIFKRGAVLQLITLPEFHFDMVMAARLANGFVGEGQGMLAYSQLVQEPEFEMRDKFGYDGVMHQRKAMLASELRGDYPRGPAQGK